MEKLPLDIINKIETDYQTIELQKYVTEKLLTIFSKNINVGIEQLIRCILIISNGNINEFNKIFESNFYGDPRDLLMTANETTNNKINYGLKPFIKNK
jgi:hypothetical protein